MSETHQENPKMEVKCVVACTNSNGEPDLWFVIVQLKKEEYEHGVHYCRALEECSEEGYRPFLAYDEFDPPGKGLCGLFEWDTATIIFPSPDQKTLT